MKLAEALQIRADLQNKISDLGERLYTNASYQEGEKPLENPISLKNELELAIVELEKMIYRIHLTNSSTETEAGTLTKLLAKREVLQLKLSAYNRLANGTSEIQSRYSRNEIKLFPSVDIAKFRKEIDSISRELRELDNLIQATNWLTELL